MKIFVKAKPSAKEEHVEKVSDAEFIVSVKDREKWIKNSQEKN